jgi:hypothetical protein
VGAIACILALAALLWQTASNEPLKILTLVLMIGLSVGIEILYWTISRRRAK